MNMTKKEREEFLADVHVGVFSVADGERGPLTCPIWYSYEAGGDIVLVTEKGSRKARALARATRASFVVQREDLPYKYVSVEGPVSIEKANVDAYLRPIAHRYLGQEMGDGYLAATRSDGSDEEKENILVRIRPERWLTVDYAKQFGDV